MTDNQICLAMLLCLICGFAFGWLWCQRKILFWRLAWINLEHRLANMTGRPPRNINQYERDGDPSI